MNLTLTAHILHLGQHYRFDSCSHSRRAARQLLVMFGVAVISVLANGVFAEWEDRRPRGFLNPDPESPDPEGPETHRRVAEGN